MSLRGSPLRVKLIAAVLIPLMVLAGLQAQNIRSSLDQRDAAEASLQEISTYLAIAGFGDAVIGEEIALNNPRSTDADLATARAGVDEGIARLNDGSLGLDQATLSQAKAVYEDIQGSRQVLGDSMAQFLLNLGAEVASGGTAGEETVTQNLLDFEDYVERIFNIAQIDFAAVSDAQTARNVTTLALMERNRQAYLSEGLAFQRIGSFPAPLITDQVTRFTSTQTSRSDEARESLLSQGTPEYVAPLEQYFASEEYAAYLETRQLFLDAVPGEAVGADLPTVFAQVGLNSAVLAAQVDVLTGDLTRDSEALQVDANEDILRTALIGLGLLVLVALVVGVLYRAIRSPLRRLEDRASEIAKVELPGIVRLMREGTEETELPEIRPIEKNANDEIGQLTEAFNDLHRTAVDLAGEQAKSRRVVADMFVNLGRRNQKLLKRLLSSLGALEQSEQDPDILAGLYDIDHLATRMRRNAESLLVLAGAAQSRVWNHPVPVDDVIRAALAEVEGYERVEIASTEPYLVKGGVVADLTHLLAELIENALTFSPPTERVGVLARMTHRGLMVAVSDNGVGMTPEGFEGSNRRITSAADQDETPSEFLGLYVVGRLAARHGIAVDLLESTLGGVSARVVLPKAVIAEVEAPTYRMADPTAAIEHPNVEQPAPFQIPATLTPESHAVRSEVVNEGPPPLRPPAEAPPAHQSAPLTHPRAGSETSPLTSVRIPDSPAQLAAEPTVFGVNRRVPGTSLPNGSVDNPPLNSPQPDPTTERQPENYGPA